MENEIVISETTDNETMYSDFIRKRIDDLRTENNLSERALSLNLGHGSSYIFDIRTGRSLPSWNEFFYLCEYFKITPHEFFDMDSNLPLPKQQAKAMVNGINNSDIGTILAVLDKFSEN